MRLGAHNSRNARKGVRGGLPTRADEAGRSALHRCTRTPRGVNSSCTGRNPANCMEVIELMKITIECRPEEIDALLQGLADRQDNKMESEIKAVIQTMTNVPQRERKKEAMRYD